MTRTWDESKVRRDRAGRFTDRAPQAKLQGFVRAGDHPMGYGRAYGPTAPERDPLTQSTHPEAGGVWYDPSLSAGKRRYVNDSGFMPVSGFRPKSRGQQHREDVLSRRREDWTGTPESRERRSARDGGKIGYEFDDVSPESLAALKRKRARARQDRTAVVSPRRRTPRGTQVENWMLTASDRMARGR